jgi:hypothetical protein
MINVLSFFFVSAVSRKEVKILSSPAGATHNAQFYFPYALSRNFLHKIRTQAEILHALIMWIPTKFLAEKQYQKIRAGALTIEDMPSHALTWFLFPTEESKGGNMKLFKQLKIFEI